MIEKEVKSRINVFAIVSLLAIFFACSSGAQAFVDAGSYLISADKLNIVALTGEIHEEKIIIKNLVSAPMRITMSIDKIGEYVTLANNSMYIPANGDGEIRLWFISENVTGEIDGHLKIAGAIKRPIPIKIRFEDAGSRITDKMLVEVELHKRTVLKTTSLKSKVDLISLISEGPEVVNVTFELRRLEGSEILPEVYYRDVVEVSVVGTQSLVKEVALNRSLEIGDYALHVEARNNKINSTTDAIFRVRNPFYEYEVFDILPIWILLAFFMSLGVLYGIYKVAKRLHHARRRFHVTIEYNLLPKKDERALFFGKIAETEKRAYWDMDVLTVHSIVAGSTGGGKTIAAQDIVEECLLKGVAVAVFDPTAQWSGMLRKCKDLKMMSNYPAFGFKMKDSKAFPGNIRAVKDGREIIELDKYLKEGEIHVFTTNTLDSKDYDVFVANTIRSVFKSNPDEFRGLRKLLVFDEIHRILPKFGGSGQGFIQIERACREFRKWGYGMLLVSQVLSDFVGEIKANINTQIQMKTRDEGDLNRIKTTFGAGYVHELVKSPVGTGLVQNSAFNRGRPYYITFRPILHSVVRLKDDELDKYNKYNGIVDDYDYQLKQLEEMKHDVFDLRLELKLAGDKIKSGNFNMVQIYLDGLTPRIDRVWTKLGKTPKKMQIKLVSEEALQESIDVARRAREDYEKAQAEKASTESAKSEEKEGPKEKKLTKEDVELNESTITEVADQINDALRRGDKDYANELFVTLPSLLEGMPDDAKKKNQQSLDNLKELIKTGIVEETKEGEKAGEAKEASGAKEAGEENKTGEGKTGEGKTGEGKTGEGKQAEGAK